MGMDVNIPIPEEEEIAVEMMECINCEARYSILLGEDYLHEEAHYCPFCGEYNIMEE